MSLAGRKIRINISLDGGTTYTPIEGSTSDNFEITKEGILITDKDDLGVQTYIDDDIGTWAMSGGFEGIIKDTDLVAFMNDTVQFTYDCELMIGGLGTYTGKFGITNMAITGAEGTDPATMTGTLASSGTIAFA